MFYKPLITTGLKKKKLFLEYQLTVMDAKMNVYETKLSDNKWITDYLVGFIDHFWLVFNIIFM